ncbi:hypothetical protein LCGC14_1218140 [marine sediment metagenome]|uniref:ERCC4 domain-containing protein n=1 Tax=marine sediment metagenome TaxID=412755 RepID=A0A0F9LC59_9ZZZZ
MTAPSPTIIIARNEQIPFVFTNMPSEPGTLVTGDYNVKGLEHLITVERKSLSDLLGCIGGDRDRFKRELQRMRAYRFRLLVVEASAADLEAGEWRSKLQPAHVMGSLAAWTGQYSLPVWLAGTHDAGARFVERFLYQAARCIASEAQAFDASPAKPQLQPVTAYS